VERVGGEWRIITKCRRTWRMLIVYAVREKWGEERKH
jgi:hypothetical protein